MDLTLAPSREPILPEMYQKVSSLPHEIIIVSGQDVAKISWQSNQLVSYTLGQNGNHATDKEDNEMWHTPLTKEHESEILSHIEQLVSHLDHDLNHDWNPIENRGAQVTFSPIGNTAPVEKKRGYDPDRKKRSSLLAKAPLDSENIMIKFGGSTSFDYIPKDRHKGTNVQKLIDHMNWDKDDCVYFGDGLFPGGNDEDVIGVIDTVLVEDHHDTYRKLNEWF